MNTFQLKAIVAALSMAMGLAACSGSSGPSGPQGQQGPQGPQGTPGPPGSYTIGDGLAQSGSTLSVAPGGLTAAMHAWPTPTVLPFTPTAPVAGCGAPVVGGNNFGTTASLTPVTIGIMFFDQSNSGTGLKSSFTRARLVVLCRGSGTFTLGFNDCASTVATVTCIPGNRPWTASSAEFTVPGAAAYNLLATATAGTLEWANPQLVLY